MPIVEGEGDVESIRILLRHMLASMNRFDIGVALPKNTHGRSSMLKTGALERYTRLALGEEDGAGVLVLMDADDDCPVTLAREVTRRAVALNPHLPVVSVVAQREYEAWFLTSLDSIRGHLKGDPGLPSDAVFTGNVEAVRDAKQWLTNHLKFGQSYKETEYQAAMTHWLDVTAAYERSRSFRRLYHAVEEIVAAVDSGTVVVTPAASG